MNGSTHHIEKGSARSLQNWLTPQTILSYVQLGALLISVVSFWVTLKDDVGATKAEIAALKQLTQQQITASIASIEAIRATQSQLFAADAVLTERIAKTETNIGAAVLPALQRIEQQHIEFRRDQRPTSNGR